MLGKSCPINIETCLFQSQWIQSVLFYISEVTLYSMASSAADWKRQLPWLVVTCWLEQESVQWPAQTVPPCPGWWWSVSSCPPGHPTMCWGSGAHLCWLTKASAHLTKLEKRFSSKWLLVKLWHSMWTIMKSVTSPMLVCLLLWFKKRKNKLCRKNGSRDIDSLMDGNPTVCLDHV